MEPWDASCADSNSCCMQVRLVLGPTAACSLLVYLMALRRWISQRTALKGEFTDNELQAAV